MGTTKMKDIALQLGVSPSTVSRALKNDPHISMEMRKKVFEMAKENNFNKPKNTSRNIYYLIDKSYFLFTSNFYNPLIDVIEDAVQRTGYNFHFSTIDGLDQMLRVMNLNETAGVLMTSSYIEDIIPALNLYSIPFVLVDSYLPLEDTSAVVTDNVSGILKAIEYLYKRGHRRIGYLVGPQDDIDCADRLMGFRQGINMFKLDTQPEDILDCKLSMSSSYQVTMQFLRKNGAHPTAFIGANDIVTIGAMQGAKDFGLKVPYDISFIGFDGIDLASEVVPALTTIFVDREAMGQLSVNRLVELMESKPVGFHKIMLNPRIQEGGSVRDCSATTEKEEQAEECGQACSLQATTQ